MGFLGVLWNHLAWECLLEPKRDGYAHTGTASAGDVIDYQIISTLPSITSESTYLTCYTFVDTLSSGLS